MSTGSSTEPSTESSTGAWSYRAGPWFAVFGPQVTVLLPPSERDRVIDLWALVDGGGGFDEVLDGLLASGLSKLPGFVLVGASEGPTHVLLRGSGVTATLTAGGEEVVLDGGAGATWTERSLDDVTALRIEVPAEDGAAVADADFPVTTGLVRVGRVDRPAYAEPAAAAAAAAPAPETTEPESTGSESAEPAAGVSDHSLIGDDGAAPVVVPAPVDAGPERLEELTPADVSGEGAPFKAPADEAPAEEPFDAPAEEPVDEPAVEEAEAADAEPEMSPMDDLAAGTSPNASMLGEAAAEEGAEPAYDSADLPTDVMPVVGGDPLTDPLPPEDPAAEPAVEVPPPPAEPAPDGWVTPYDAPPAPAAAPGDEDTVPPPAGVDAPDVAPATDIAPPPAWSPPPPPEAPVDAPPPLGIGSWEPVTGAVPPPPPPAPAADPDHDGHTVAGAAGLPPQPGPSQPAPPSVTAPVAKLLISDGQTVLVDRVVLIGRAPEARRFSSTEQPMLVTVPSRLHEISSTHVEVRPGGGADLGTAVVTDMGSTNGTVLVQPGLGPEDLKPGIAVQLIPGAIINLGDGITIQVTRP